ncbi:pyridoxal-phosphate dependent enzyme [Marinobacterium mangrovicola]|uniref:Cysteine synthase B n=1 Tax=Marinobacterium mangrovicola TaxID=1476959 RepID=A0A4R1G9K6_9GAMM|nr:pyridoxal-phosphate dependent enzyme [Marinobacterium mangrovicola]TCK04907.1 cysteine synthase A [Marinobacterium mangrovicola]
MGTRYNNILETVGHTPVVRINHLAPPGVNLYAKLEAFNPMGSIKDRLALGVIEDAERSGALKPGQTVIEATSGNTGIGLAMVCAQKGYPLVVTMAENFSVERRRMMRFLGAKVILTPASDKGSGMLAKAVELAESHGWFLCRQFENEANADFHSRTTAVEILDDFSDTRLDYWVTGFGTGGTLKGVARVLKEKSPETHIIVCEPDNSPLLGSHQPQPRSANGMPSASHPSFRPHLMQGWTPDFISKLTEDAANAELIDELRPIAGSDALQTSLDLARREGIFCGITAGATMAGGLQIARSAPPGTTILCMLPDTGERYLSTPLFAEIETEMTTEEIEISRSTPGYRFDKPTAPAPAPAAAPTPATIKATPQAEQFLADALQDKNNPVVMFALEWCEFCWSLRKLFKQCNIPYRSVDLDSAQYQQDNLGGSIRAALNAHTGCVTIPQIFVGGEFVGGCTEVFDEFKSGRFQQRLEDSSVSFDHDVSVDPYSLLPTWLHPRK